jgi:hypothetical protein
LIAADIQKTLQNKAFQNWAVKVCDHPVYHLVQPTGRQSQAISSRFEAISQRIGDLLGMDAPARPGHTR